jgi:multidrug resistance efflux pump
VFLFYQLYIFMQESPVSSPVYRAPSRSLLSNLLIASLSAGLIVWTFRLIQERFFSITSVDAVVNGIVTDIRAPQAGVVSTLKGSTGKPLDRDQPLLTIENRRISQLQIESLKGKLSQQQAELERAEAKLNQQLTLLQTVTVDQEQQQYLETVAAQHSTEKVASDLKGAQARHQLAKVNYDRIRYLAAQGALSQSRLDAAAAEVQERSAEVTGLERQIKALQASEQAARLNLSLAKTSSNSDPRIRLEELQMQIADQRQVIQTLRKSIQGTEAELAQANIDVERQQSVVVNAPTTGVIWRLAVQPGKFVQQGESLGQVLNCSGRWVDAFVDEQAARSLQPGTPATVKLYGAESQVLQGQVSSIRPGSGRLSAGEDIAVPVASNAPRKAQVRVDLDPGTEQGSFEQFCYVGHTAQVSFKVR